MTTIDGTTIEIGGLTFYGTPHPSRLQFRRLIDWDSVPESKSQREDRPQGHGTFDPGEDFRVAATPSFEGWYQGSSRADALAMRQRIAGALAGEGLRITVTNELGPTYRDVSVRHAPLKDVIGNRFEFAVDMHAADPRRYGPAVRSSTGVPAEGGGIVWPLSWPLTWEPGGSTGRVTAANSGTVSTFALLEVTGGLERGFSAVEVGTGREIRFERVVPLGSTVFVDQRTGRAWIDDPANDVAGFLTRKDWFATATSGQSVIQFNPIGAVTGDPTLTAEIAPAYW